MQSCSPVKHKWFILSDRTKVSLVIFLGLCWRQASISSMIIPCLTLKAGKVLNQNKQGIPADTWYEKFFLCPQISIVCTDHDDETLELVKGFSKKSSCTVQFSSSDFGRILDALDSGARNVVLEKGSPLLGDIPKERVTIAVECQVDKATVTEMASEMNTLKSHASSILLSCRGEPGKAFSIASFVKELDNLIGKDVKLVITGDIACSYTVISDLHSLGMDVHVSSVSSLDIGEAIVACLKSDRPDGLFSTIVADEHNTALGLVFSSKESVLEAVKTKRGVYHSRNRGLWRKGESSGNVQELLKISIDCDSDALRFTVQQEGEGFCHLNTWTCFGQSGGLPSLMRTLVSRRQAAPPGSYTDRLYKDSMLLHAKIMEEASELCEAKTKEDVAWEAADVLYFALVKCAKAGVSLADVEAALDQRALKVQRRPGNAKPKWAEAIENKSTPTEAKPSEAKSVSNGGMLQACYELKSLGPKQLQELCKRPATLNSPKLESLVRSIIDNVKVNGDKALLELTEKFDKVKLTAPVLEVESLQAPALDEEVRAAIDLAYDNIYKFHEAQLNPKPLEVETCKGVKCSRHVRPIEKVGLYVPGGSAVLPSTALMLGIPAKLVSCHEIIIATPPTKDGTVCPEILYIAKKVGASKILLAVNRRNVSKVGETWKELICDCQRVHEGITALWYTNHNAVLAVNIGGAQAVAAMAYGTDSVPKVDKICGPGNQFVTMAKMLVQNDSSAIISIDMPAGPSEVMVVADQTAEPSFVAADLLSQAEHGPDSQVVLVAINLTENQLTAIQNELEHQIKKLPRQQIAQAALSKSFVIKVSDMTEAIHFSNMYSPEHLIINAKNAESCLPSIHNAGSVFLGPYSSESCGDYASGTNHTLPTYGYARMYSGVSTATFQKHITAQCVSKEGLANIGPAVATLAAVENLDAHRNAILIRQEYIKKNDKY